MSKISTISLLKMQTMINNIIIILENNLMFIKENKFRTQQQIELIDYLVGKKENIVSVLTKLINLSLKLNNNNNKNLENKNNSILTGIDVKIINKFFKKNID